MKQQTIKVFDSDAIIIRNSLKLLKKNNVNSNSFILNCYLILLEFSSADMYAKKLKKLRKKD